MLRFSNISVDTGFAIFRVNDCGVGFSSFCIYVLVGDDSGMKLWLVEWGSVQSGVTTWLMKRGYEIDFRCHMIRREMLNKFSVTMQLGVVMGRVSVSASPHLDITVLLLLHAYPFPYICLMRCYQAVAVFFSHLVTLLFP
jgi:hypothetical protein